MSTPSATWIDGHRGADFPLPDRGLDYGDGLFETLRLERGEPLFPELHWQRLEQGLETLGFPDCIARIKSQTQLVLDDLRQEGWSLAALRITVTRGAGPRGYTPPLDAEPRIICSATPLEAVSGALPPPASLIAATMRWASQPALAGVKHLNRLEQVLAAAEKQRSGADEALMLGQAGQLVSVTSGNLFIVAGDEIHTPLLDDCGIAGTRRHLVMQSWAPAAGYSVKESRLELSILDAATEVFYSNSLVGLRPVASLGDLRWNSHKVCADLYRCYRESLA